MSATVVCGACGKPVPVGDRFCASCGAAVANASAATVMAPQHQGPGTTVTQCGKCRAPMGRDDQFCPRCGTSRPEEATVVSHVSLRNSQAAHLIEATKGDFEILQQLGTGAMGAVYLAKDVSLGRKVAIKVIASNLLSDATMISRFRFEAQTVAALRHPNVVNVHAVRQSADLHYFVMEYIDGPPLRSLVKNFAPLDVDVVQAIIFQVGSALAYAHRSAGGVIHRDVKPANIMLDREGDAFVTDFGISKMAEAQSGLTQTGATIGTPEYMSPEQCRGDALTGASDQYSLGIVAYEMLVGGVPFSGSQYNIMVSHTSERPPALAKVRPDLPAQVADAIERMLAKTPQERWPDLDTAVAALGGAPLGYQSPVRQKIKGLIGATQSNIPAVRTGQPAAVSGGAASLDTATSVSVVGLPPVLEVGDRYQLQADVKGTGNTSLSGAGVLWMSTDTSIARVEGSWVQALKPGSVSITAAAGNVASSVLLHVEEAKPVKVVVRPAAVTMQKGGRITLSAVVQDKQGKEVPQPVMWTSSDPSIASVSPKGEVLAQGGGKVTITAGAGGTTGTAAISVEASAAATAAAPAAKPAAVPAGKPAPQARPAARARPAAEDRPFYKRPGAMAASVVLLGAIGFGVMSLTGGGSEIIPGTNPAPVSDPGAQPVGTTPAPSPGAPAGSTGSGGQSTQPAQPAPTSGSSGSTASTPAPTQPTATRAPTPQPGAPQASSSPAQAAGQQPQSTTAAAGQRPPVATAAAPARVDIGELPPVMQQGGTASASAQVFGASGGALAAGSYTLSWRSSDPSAVTVTPQGAVRAARAGSAWIVASAGDARDSVRIRVAAAVASVDIAVSDLSLRVGEPARALSVSVLDADRQPIARTLSWSSSNPGVASVDGAGRVTAVGPGTARITASADGFSDQVGVTVAAAQAAAPAPTAAPAPARAPAAAPPALPSAAEVRGAIDAYVAVLGRNDRDTVTRLWGSAPAGDRGDLLEALGQREVRATLGEVSAPTLEGSAAIVTFPVSVAYRTSFGQNRNSDFRFRARLERSGSQWAVVAAVLQ